MKIEIIEKELDFNLSQLEKAEISSQVKELQGKVESLLSQLMSGRAKRMCKIVRQTDEQDGVITEYYDGSIISKTKEVEQQVLIQEKSETKTSPYLENLKQDPIMESQEEVEEGPVFELDSQYDILGL